MDTNQRKKLPVLGSFFLLEKEAVHEIHKTESLLLYIFKEILNNYKGSIV
jgi:hypothetical protein